MGKKTIIWLIVAVSLILAGCAVFGIVITQLQGDFSQLSTSKFETVEHRIDRSFKNISITTNTANVLFVPSEGNTHTVICHQQENVKHAVTLDGDTLVVEAVDTRKWYEFIGLNFDTPKITIYTPQGQYGALTITSDTGDVKIPKDYAFKSISVSESTGDVTNYAPAESIQISTGTGNIRIENVSANTLALSVSTGMTDLTNIHCQNFTSHGNTGDIALKNVISTEKLSIVRSTGDITFDRCDANEISVETDTGNVTGTLLTEKVFTAKTDTGKVRVPHSESGGKCEITTDTGDIAISIIYTDI